MYPSGWASAHGDVLAVLARARFQFLAPVSSVVSGMCPSSGPASSWALALSHARSRPDARERAGLLVSLFWWVVAAVFKEDHVFSSGIQDYVFGHFCRHYVTQARRAL